MSHERTATTVTGSDGATTALEIEALHVAVHSHGHEKHLVKGVSISINRGECVALVGESGSGKSLTALAVMRLLDQNMSFAAQRLAINGRETLALTPRSMRKLCGNQVAMVFQDPMSSLNPVMRIETQIAETIIGKVKRQHKRRRVHDLLDRVGISSPARVARMYPHQLSGGMRQRVMIAMALANDPALIIADEPTTALDVSTQAQVLDLLVNVTSDESRALLIISHDLGVVSAVADRVYVMYQGELVERGATTDILQRPQHAYTRRLLGAVARITDPIKGRYEYGMNEVVK